MEELLQCGRVLRMDVLELDGLKLQIGSFMPFAAYLQGLVRELGYAHEVDLVVVVGLHDVGAEPAERELRRRYESIMQQRGLRYDGSKGFRQRCRIRECHACGGQSVRGKLLAEVFVVCTERKLSTMYLGMLFVAL